MRKRASREREVKLTRVHPLVFEGESLPDSDMVGGWEEEGEEERRGEVASGRGREAALEGMGVLKAGRKGEGDGEERRCI